MDILSSLGIASGAWMAILFFLTIVALAIASTVFWIVELVDVAKRTFYDPNQKIVWIIIILALHFVGSLIYYCVGKQQGYLPGEQPRR